MVIFWNGKFLSEKEAPILSIDASLLRGVGLFETMRAYQKNIIYFTHHITRIKNSAKILGFDFPYSIGEMKNFILRLLELNSFKDAHVRLTLWRTKKLTEILVSAKEYKPLPLSKYKRGFTLDIASLRQDEHPFFTQHKTTSRVIYEVSFEKAQKRGFDEAVMLNQRGYISECTRSNIFFVKDKTLFTPALSCGCLGGITRQVVYDLAAQGGIKIYEGRFTLGDLSAADEVFLTNSLIGLMPVKRVGSQYVSKTSALKITGLLIRQYRNLLRRK